MPAPDQVRGELGRTPRTGAGCSHAGVDPRLRRDDGVVVSDGVGRGDRDVAAPHPDPLPIAGAGQWGEGVSPHPANLSPPPRPRVFSPLPVRAGRFREACRGRGQEAVSDLWSGDRHYVSQAFVVKSGRGNPHGSLLRTRKCRRRAPRGRLKNSKTVAGRRPPPVQLSIDRGAMRGRVRRHAWSGIAAVRTRGGMGPGHPGLRRGRQGPG